jgi:hypothetical protein
MVKGKLSDGVNEIDSKSNTTFLSPGIQVVKLFFDGMDIYRNGEHGSYIVALTLCDINLNEMDTDAHITQSYFYDQFQPPGVMFLPPHSDYGEDTDSDGLFNYLVVNVTLMVIESGTYDIEGSLYDPGNGWIDNDANSTYLEAGVRVVQLRFYGVGIFNNEENGSFKVELNAYDPLRLWLHNDTYFTNFYNFDDFQTPPAEFVTPHSDYGLDTDSDGYFNYLVVNVSVNVSLTGTYRVEGHLFRFGSPLIDFADNTTFLNLGLNVVQLYFDGSIIYEYGGSGNFIIFLDLFDEDNNSVDSSTYVTIFYNSNQFQPSGPPSPPTNQMAQLYGSGSDVMLTWDASPDDGGGEDDVAGYTVYRSSTGIDGTFVNVSWIVADDSTSYSWTDSGAGDGDPNDYFYMVRAKDILNMEELNTNKVGKVVYDLVEGWNLISIPLEQFDTSRETVVQTLGSNYIAIRGYHAGKAKPWMHWHRNKPDPLNNVITVDHENGYYIKMQSADSLVIAGKVRQSTSISLETGWNLVGYPSLVSDIQSNVLSSISGSYNRVENYNTVTGKHQVVNPGDLMYPGLGYWIHVTEPCILTI